MVDVLGYDEQEAKELWRDCDGEVKECLNPQEIGELLEYTS